MSSAMTSSANSISTSTVYTPSTNSIDIKQEVKQEVEIKTEPDIKQEPNSEGGKQVKLSHLSSTYCEQIIFRMNSYKNSKYT